MMHEDVPGARPLFATPAEDGGYARIQRSAEERRTNRLRGLAIRRTRNQQKNLVDQIAAVARRQRKEKTEPFEDGIQPSLHSENFVLTTPPRVLPRSAKEYRRGK
jgi:hypothetical protein